MAIKREYKKSINFDNLILDRYPFRHYVSEIQAHLEQTMSPSRRNLGPERVLEANSPFEWLPQAQPTSKKGVLLIHGLLDSPYSLRHIGKLYLEQGFLVRSMLLPGHGTSPQDLLSVNYDDWIKAIDYAMLSLEQSVDQIMIVGFSAGATLALLHANHPKVKGVVLLAPAIQLKAKLLRYLQLFSPVHTRIPPLAWYQVLEEIDYAKYRSIPFHLAYEAYRLSTYNKKLLQREQIQCPILLAVSEEDETICVKAAKQLFKIHSHPHSQMILYGKNPQPWDDHRLQCRHSVHQEQHILDYSHVCIPIAPDDGHYGMNGDYLPDLHQPKNNAHHAPENIVLGALNHRNLSQHAIRRLTYNPDFDFLAQQIRTFTAQC